MMILAHAMTDIQAKGWWGKVLKDGKEGSSNIGPVGGKNDRTAGDATNVVTDYVLVKGESRSHDARFFKAITNAYKDAFGAALKKVLDHEGKPGRMKFASRTDYFPFKISEKAAVVAKASRGVLAIGRTPNIRTANGGLDANWMVKHNIPTVTFGAGQNDIHTVKEWVDLAEFEAGCQLAVALATNV